MPSISTPYRSDQVLLPARDRAKWREPTPNFHNDQAQYTTFPILDKPVNYLGIGKNHPFADLFLRDPQGLYSLHKIIAKVAVKLPLDLSNLFFPLVGKGAGEVLPDNLPAITYQTIDNYIEDI